MHVELDAVGVEEQNTLAVTLPDGKHCVASFAFTPAPGTVPEIGPLIWTRLHIIPFVDGQWDGQRDRVYLVRRGTVRAALYMATLVAVYGASFLSHAVQVPLWRQRFRMLDQGFIYLLIAGTYTPYALAYLAVENIPFSVEGKAT